MIDEFLNDALRNRTRIGTLYFISIWCILLCVGSYFCSQMGNVEKRTAELQFFHPVRKPALEPFKLNQTNFRHLSIENNGAKLHVLSKFQWGCVNNSGSRHCSKNGTRSPLLTCLLMERSPPHDRAGQWNASSDDGDYICSEVQQSTDNVFFLETSCAANQSKRLPVLRDAFNRSSEPLNTLLDLPNFFYGWVILEDFFANTSLLEFYRVLLATSSYPVAHHADALRIYLLYRYGGTYMDLDVIILKPFDELGTNYVGLENKCYTANGIMNFEPEHEFLKKYMIAASMHYNPQDWNSIGPELLTNLTRKCGHIKGNFNTDARTYISSCNLTLLPPNTFYPIKYRDWKDYYNSTKWPEVEKIVNGSHAVHYWNHMGSPELGNRTDDVPIIKLAEQHCPPLPLGAGR